MKHVMAMKEGIELKRHIVRTGIRAIKKAY